MAERAHILVVDDNISLCKSMALVLEHNGYAVTVAIDGLEAMDRVRERHFDVTFMDIKMPVMDGVETYRRIKRIRPDPMVIMMTAYSVENLVDEALQEGAYSVLHKPMEMDKVLRMLGEILERKQQALPPNNLSINGLNSVKDVLLP